jgi:hypothetical protein
MLTISKEIKMFSDILIIKNFLTPDECTVLNSWVDDNITSDLIGSAYFPKTKKFNNPKRYTTRMTGHRFKKYSLEVYKIFDYIQSELKLNKYQRATLGSEGIDGVVVSCVLDGGDVHSHKDTMYAVGNHTLRCNIMTRKPEAGGLLYIEGTEIELEQGDLHCYLVTKHEHWVSEVSGNVSRVLWMFGIYVPIDFNIYKLKDNYFGI